MTELPDWLESERVTHGVMEATGAYWKPVWHVLEEAVELVLANARDVKNVKVLEDANIKLSSVMSDVTGLSGRKMLVALIEGETDPDRLAELGSVWLKASKEDLRAALHGFVREHHRFMLRLHLDQINALDAAIREASGSRRRWSRLPGLR